VRVLVAGEGEEKKLAFEYFPAEPKPKAKSEDGEEDDGDEEDGDSPALVEAAPRKALSGPREKKERPRTGAVPSVPRRKDD
jgi:ATP-dependent Clp protease ATP-binding subunit ClpA